MEILINGTTLEVPKTINTITELIAHLNLKSPVIIVEHNDIILKDGEHEKVQVQAADKVEFVQFIGGG